jgi:SPX domain protein involved in polyphosphate accumulation
MALAFAEGCVTQSRQEFKLVMPAMLANKLAKLLAFDLNMPNAPSTLITSVYFDERNFSLAKRALKSPHDCVKVRTKEYFPDLGDSNGPRLVLEVKREQSGLTNKNRTWLSRADFATAASTSGAGSLLRAIHAGELHGVLAVTYRRRVYQDDARWRVTIDDELSFYRVDQLTALSATPLTHERLGPPEETDDRVIVEVKHRGKSLPEWLSQLEGVRTSRFSKFAEGMSRLVLKARALGDEGEEEQVRVH